MIYPVPFKKYFVFYKVQKQAELNVLLRDTYIGSKTKETKE